MTLFKNYTLHILFIFLLVGCKQKESKNVSTSLTLYHNGDILTMEGEAPQYAEALVVDSGMIAFVGSLKEAKAKYKSAKKYDLKGKTMLPGFLDGHSHCMFVGIMKQLANLLPPPDGPGADIQSIITVLNEWKESEEGKAFINKTGIIVGNGYDDSQLAEKDHPKASDLDKVSTELPVFILHQSGHLAVVNNKALEVMGWVGNVKNPEEGVLRRNPDSTPNGVLEENAAFSTLMKIVVPKIDKEMSEKAVDLFLSEYAANGYTTVQDGRSTLEIVSELSEAADNKKLYLDIVSYPDMRISYEPFSSPYYTANHTYKNHFRIGGAKLTLDGSPQGKTAWLTQHYHIPPQGKKEDYLGYPIMSDEKCLQYVQDAFQNKWQLICHTNGDAAIDQYLTAVEKVEEQYKYDDHRTTIIHGQTIRKDQIEKAATLGVGASLFPMHTFYWGDWHIESVLGHPRADYISPCKDAIMAGLNITSHHDAPVTFPNSMRVLDATVNRVTRSGAVLGPDQRISVFDGLRTLTIWAAIQYFEEDTKGSLRIGKRADLVILDKNPIKIDPLEINKIKIHESIKDGKSVYSMK